MIPLLHHTERAVPLPPGKGVQHRSDRREPLLESIHDGLRELSSCNDGDQCLDDRWSVGSDGIKKIIKDIATAIPLPNGGRDPERVLPLHEFDLADQQGQSIRLWSAEALPWCVAGDSIGCPQTSLRTCAPSLNAI